ncbi:MAG TPA: hypothetical protein VK674_06475 [Candidatus Limnocylindria bacterium]|nr:hypothetical protein [Candidatus Limnocylindria bacterium]
MRVEDLLKRARELWPGKMTDQEVAIAMGVVYGEICRYVRDRSEGRKVDDAEIKKELGNMLFSTIRWCDDMGLAPEECIKLAVEAQEKYVRKKLGAKTFSR